MDGVASDGVEESALLPSVDPNESVLRDRDSNLAGRSLLLSRLNESMLRERDSNLAGRSLPPSSLPGASEAKLAGRSPPTRLTKEDLASREPESRLDGRATSPLILSVIHSRFSCFAAKW